jgi:hypothetical protein
VSGRPNFNETSSAASVIEYLNALDKGLNDDDYKHIMQRAQKKYIAERKKLPSDDEEDSLAPVDKSGFLEFLEQYGRG